MLEIRVGGRRFRTTLVAAPRSLVSTMVAPDLATADAATYGSAMLDSFKIDISHQEMERIIIELELIYKTQPGQWLPITVRAAVPSHSARRPPGSRGFARRRAETRRAKHASRSRLRRHHPRASPRARGRDHEPRAPSASSISRNARDEHT
jgi:hypothetical protein